MVKDTRNAYNKWSEIYDTEPNPQILLEHDNVVEMVSPLPGEKILDAACGTGKYSGEFYSAEASVTGIDFSGGMLEVARAKYPGITFLNADLTEKLPFNDEDFDKINCAQALKHIENLRVPLKEFYRVLKKKGKLIFSVTHPEMNWEGFEMRDEVNFSLVEEAVIFHHKFYDYFSAIDSAGFKKMEIKQVQVSEKIRHLLTDESFERVKGRYEVIIFKLFKE